MLIGQVAELTGATRKAIRHYETIELIPSPKEAALIEFIASMT
ncbi:MerR family DNA-binding transcriptional regulator [Psychromonas sp. KJ10-10]